VLAGSFSNVTASNSVASGNSSVGFIASAGAGSGELNVSSSTSSNNNVALQAGGGAAPATLRASNVSQFGNNLGYNIGANGTLKSFGNNPNANGGTPTAPNLTVN